MKTKTISHLIWIVAAATLVWSALMVWGEASQPPVHSLAERIAATDANLSFFHLNYANAGLLTLACTAMLAALASYVRDESLLVSGIASALVPIYGGANLLVYFSQVFVVPGLLDMYHAPASSALAEAILGLTLHAWQPSAAAFVNAMAYAVLGVISVILAPLMARKAPELRAGSTLLAVSGVLAWPALAGLALGNAALSALSIVSAAPYLLGLILLGRAFHKLPATFSSQRRDRGIPPARGAAARAGSDLR